MEADDVLVLGRSFVEPHFRLRDPERVAAVEPENRRDALALGRAFAVAWVEEAAEDEIAAAAEAVLRSIPTDIDRQLLSYGVRALEVRRLEDQPKRALRQGFRQAIGEIAGRRREPDLGGE